MTINCYRVWGVLAHEKSPVYCATTCPPEEPHDLVEVELPDGWSWWYNEAHIPVLEAPDGLPGDVLDFIKADKNDDPIICSPDELRGWQKTTWHKLKWRYVSNNLRSLRQMRGLTQQELADKSGVNIRNIQKIESGEIKVGNLSAKNFMALAEALNVYPADILMDV